MYLVVVSEQFPNQIGPVVSFESEATRDDAMMKARCRRIDAQERRHEATIEVHCLNAASRLRRFVVPASAANGKVRKRR